MNAGLMSVTGRGLITAKHCLEHRRYSKRFFRPGRVVFAGIGLLAILGGGTLRADATVIYASASQTNNVPDGTSWSTAFKTVQEAIAAASDGDSVWVAAGTYFENITLSGSG
jgi:hypothetical protein